MASKHDYIDISNQHVYNIDIPKMTYDQLQSEKLSLAQELASNGQEFAHLIKTLSPENSLRLKLHVQSLPKSAAERTIYGKAHWKEQSLASQKRRK